MTILTKILIKKLWPSTKCRLARKIKMAQPPLKMPMSQRPYMSLLKMAYRRALSRKTLMALKRLSWEAKNLPASPKIPCLIITRKP